MAGGPSVTATIQGNDLLTGVLTKVVENSHALMAKVNGGVEEHLTRQSAAVDGFKSRFMTSAKAIDVAATGMFAGMGMHFLKEASHVATEMSAMERKMIAFGGVSKRQADDLRRYADTTASGSTGGPVGQTDLVTQLLMNGYKTEQAKVLMEPISIYALETGQPLNEAATEFDGHMAMLHRTRDDRGREISTGAATPEQLKRAAEETLGALSTYFQQMKGKISDVMEFSKVAAPSANMLKVPEHTLFAEEAVLSQNGIRGEVAGTAVAGFHRRLIGQTAKGRAAMAEAGLHYSDYVKLNPELITTEGVTAAFEQRAGSADAGEKAKIAATVERFHQDSDYDTFNKHLADAFASSGNKGLHNHVAAANAAADISKGAVTGVDDEKFLQYVHDKNVPVGLIQTMFREQGNAVMTLAQGVAELKRIRAIFDGSNNQAAYQKAQDEQHNNYAGSQQNLSGAWTGLQAEAFRPLEGALTSIFNTVAEGIRSVAGASDGAKVVLDAVLLSGTAIGALTLTGTLANIAGGLTKFATGAEAVGPVVGALGLLADIPFIPIVAGIAAVVAGFEAFQHRAELWHKFELWKNGETDAPTTPEDANKLRDKVAQDRQALADRQKAIEDHAVVMDPAVRAAREHASEVYRRGLLAAENDPAVTKARDNLAEVENHNPRHDVSIRDAHNRLAEVERDFNARQGVTDAKIESLKRVVDRTKHQDPFVGEALDPTVRAAQADLKRTQEDLARARGRLGPAAETDQGFRALDDHRKEREAYLVNWQKQVIAMAAGMIDQERDKLGAPNVTADDVTQARQAAEQAPALAQARHSAEVEKAQAEVDRLVAIARGAVETSQAVVEANAAAAQAADSARNGPRAKMDLQADATGGLLPNGSSIAGLTAEVDKLTGVLAAYDKAHATAYAASHPTFTRPEHEPGPTSNTTHIDLSNMPAPDYAHASVPRTGPAFDMKGPVLDTAALANSLSGSLSASIMKMVYPERAPQEVNVHSDVHSDVAVKGTVTGTISGTTQVEVAVQPSPMLLATVKRAEMASRVALSGDVAGSGGDGSYMGGTNGVQQYPGGVHPAGR